MPVAAPEHSAAAELLAALVAALAALLLLHAVVAIADVAVGMQEPASRGTLVLHLAASAASVLLNPVVRPSVLAEVART